MQLSTEHVFLNNNLLSAITNLIQKLDYLTIIVEAFAESSGDELFKNVERKVCERLYISLLEMKKNNRSPDLQVARVAQKQIDDYRELMVKNYGEDFVIGVENEYNISGGGEPVWMIKNMKKI